ncbi:MAG TPA: alpha/beta hydrolase [Terriglobales bacterium]|nr:alpha/beta hydrolase [Terriglobales bacterium]
MRTPVLLWVSRVAAVLIFLLAIGIAIAAGLLVPYFLAARTESILALTISAVASFALFAWAGTKFALSCWGTPRWKLPAMMSGLLTVIFLGWLYISILRPTGSHFASAVPYANTKYWQLPTGSMIAYSEFDPPRGVAVRPEAIVYLHGGPGVRQGPFDQDIYGSFAANGFRVFLYDQAGSGLSGFLPHVRDYTVARSVVDLEAIRQKIGVEKMILIGHSWGSTLAASYMAKFPTHVAKAVFHAPSRIWRLESGESYDFSRTDAGPQVLPNLRLLAALYLRDRNPDAAEKLVSQQESEILVVPSFRQTLGTVVCKGDFNELPSDLISVLDGHENPGVNPYVLQELVPDTEHAENDPHTVLRENHTPAILLYPECNYLAWSGALDYRRTLPNLKIYYIPKAGHYIQFGQPEMLKRVILAFFLDQPDLLPPYTSDADPRSNQR